MPYRALLATIVTVALALLAVGLWVGAVAPMISESDALMKPLATSPAATHGSNPAVQLHRLTQGVLILSFVLIIILLVVGIFATTREWIRRTPNQRKRVRTRFVDAWKIAGDRLNPDDPPPPPPDEPLQ